MTRGSKGDISIQFIGTLLFILLVLVVSLWLIGLLSGGSFSLFDKIVGWFRW